MSVNLDSVPCLWLNLQKRYDLQRRAKINAIPTLEVA
jgi:plasmid maintenance system antidote protein VapI